MPRNPFERQYDRDQKRRAHGRKSQAKRKAPKKIAKRPNGKGRVTADWTFSKTQQVSKDIGRADFFCRQWLNYWDDISFELDEDSSSLPAIFDEPMIYFLGSTVDQMKRIHEAIRRRRGLRDADAWVRMSKIKFREVMFSYSKVTKAFDTFQIWDLGEYSIIETRKLEEMDAENFAKMPESIRSNWDPSRCTGRALGGRPIRMGESTQRFRLRWRRG